MEVSQIQKQNILGLPIMTRQSFDLDAEWEESSRSFENSKAILESWMKLWEGISWLI